MALSNYPPGVTGGEFAISGPLFEWEIPDYECPACEDVVTGDAWYHPSEGANVQCPECDDTRTLPDEDIPGGPDEDRAYDEWKDDRLDRDRER